MSNDRGSASRRSKNASRFIAKRNTLNKERWILSYADFITLLFAFFVALYSLSIQNAGNERLLSETLEGVFDAVQKSIQPINIGEPTTNKVESESLFDVDPNETKTDEDPGTTAPEDGSPVYNQLSQLVANELQNFQAQGLISISEDSEWIEVDLKSELVFGAGEYELTNDAVAILMSITAILNRYPSPVFVEGHSDDLPIVSSRYTSNWHLSASRAASVVDEMVYLGLPPQRIAPVGFSSSVPKVRNNSDAAREQNRRVTLKISKSSTQSIHDYLFN